MGRKRTKEEIEKEFLSNKNPKKGMKMDYKIKPINNIDPKEMFIGLLNRLNVIEVKGSQNIENLYVSISIVSSILNSIEEIKEEEKKEEK